MKKYLVTLCMVAFGATSMYAQQVAQWPEVKREMKAGSRWWWLGSAVDEENLKWNMEQYAQAGIGTLEITPIYSVKNNASKNINFLTPKWLEMLKYTKQLGEQLDIDIDMTTGTGWPFGGPMVKQTESASKLVTETFTLTGDGKKEQSLTLGTSGGTLQKVMAFPQKDNSGKVTELTSMVSGRNLKWVAPEGQWQVIAAYIQYGVMNVKRPSPGSDGLVLDYFDSTAVANYLKYFDTRFEAGGNPWPHSFFNDSYEITQADWTPKMFEQFESRRGYKLEENLDKLLNSDAQVYADYRQTLSDMLSDNFTRQWTAWAHSHGATTRNQAHGSPGNLIDLYAEADIPEIENFYMNSFGIKGLRDDVGFYNKALSTKATLKYASSAAHITGKPLTSSESMTWLTEHFRTSLSQIKPELDLLFASGVNHVLFHGTAYSPKEAAWPGWKFYAAIDMSPTNSIWHDAPSMMKYIERVQSFMQMGKPDNDVLVYAPFANAMKKNTGTFKNRLLLFDINTMSTKMSELETCVKNLEAQGLDCDYTSERYLMTTTYADGLLKTAAGTTYKALVVPVSTNLPDSVKTHLDELVAAGVTVVYGNTPADLSGLSVASEAMRTDLGLDVIRRSNDTGYHYFVANLTPDDVEGYVTLAVPFVSVALFDPMTGDISKAVVKDQRVWLSLKSGQSVIVQTYDADVTTDATAQEVYEQAGIEIDGQWSFYVADGSDAPSRTLLDKLQTWETMDGMADFMGTGTYETAFVVTAQQMKAANAGFRLNLGDVRESARVWLNGEYLGCAWAAPFVLDCKGLVKEGSNTLKIEVTNLPANRIRQMDKNGTEWRIFEDINMANISSASYAGWSLVPSGLNSRVMLVPLSTEESALDLQLTGMRQMGDGHFYPAYRVTTMNGKAIKQVAMVDLDGGQMNDFTVEKETEGSAILIVQGQAIGNAIVQVVDEDDATHYANVAANGAYGLTKYVDFTSDEAPGGGWMALTSTSVIKGFDGTGQLPWMRSKSYGKSVTGLYDGLTFTSKNSNYYFYFVGYGMNTNYDFTITLNDAMKGDVCLVSYLQGQGETVYQAADSLLLIGQCLSEADGLSVNLLGNSSYRVYRSLAVYRPASVVSSVSTTAFSLQEPDAYYTLQGQRVARPGKGLYIKKGKKLVFK
ncbi:MAG: glycosyl hydrolase family 2 [Prevotella sp.]|nr:glycosyl hydrolase family 2 [Prevotella sp.]